MNLENFSDRASIFGERVGQWLNSMFGSRNTRMVRLIEPLVQEINGLESWAQGLSAEEVRAQTETFKAEIQSGETTLDDLLPRAFAMVREASVRTLGMRHFDVQLVGGIVQHRGAITEMMTGEGKTLVATLPLYLNALGGKPVYLVTVNDYLARRDAGWMGPIFEYLGLRVGAIQSSMNPWERKPVYECDIVYGTNNEFGFDYLRDNMKTNVEEQVQRVLQFAIVDEVDSILIDEARTPLIISGPAEEGPGKYKVADRIARSLKADEHYEVKEKERSASLLENGIVVAQEMVGVDSFYTPGNEDWPHFIENALRAHNLYECDKEYVVEEGDVVIVDEFTGRKMPGRRWSDGLHQAVETKEGLEPKRENQTLATITFQNYFRMFGKLAGMTGTAITEAGEFHKIYGLDVIQIPTNLPLARKDNQDVVYRTEKEKWKAIVDEIAEVHELGQPTLVGTGSIEKSEKISGLLKRRGIKHEVLNAKNHEREAHIVAMAGEHGSVTVATNMAGRGTDIKLGGNFEYRLEKALKEAELELGDVDHLAEIDAIRDGLREQCDRDEAEVLELGGLYVLGTERHEARRIDNQLRGRSGRQGDAGTSRFFLSLQDDLMRIFYRDWVTNAMERLGMSEGQPIESGMVSRAIAKAQKKVEDRNFEIRKSLLEYDEVMDEQRRTVYGVRQDVLEESGMKEKIFEMFNSVLARASETHLEDPAGFQGWFQRTFGFEVSEEIAETAVDKNGNYEAVMEKLLAKYEERESSIGSELMRKLEQYVLLNTIDSRWKDHLHAVDALKAGIGLRGYGQVDPKNEYKKEGFGLFQKLLQAIEDEITSLVLRIRIAGREDDEGDASLPAPRGLGSPSGTATATAPRVRRRVAPQRPPASAAFDVMRQRQRQSQVSAEKAGEPQAAAGQKQPEVQPAPSAPEAAFKNVGRNDPCPCGSGKKFKKCHG